MKATKNSIGVCGCLLRGVMPDCDGDWLGGDNLCDCLNDDCLKLDIKECEKLGYVKITKNNGIVVFCNILKIDKNLIMEKL